MRYTHLQLDAWPHIKMETRISFKFIIFPVCRPGTHTHTPTRVSAGKSSPSIHTCTSHFLNCIPKIDCLRVDVADSSHHIRIWLYVHMCPSCLRRCRPSISFNIKCKLKRKNNNRVPSIVEGKKST